MAGYSASRPATDRGDRAKVRDRGEVGAEEKIRDAEMQAR
jgi:hypothetical protein